MLCFSGFRERGHPDEGQQEEQTASTFIFGKCHFLFVNVLLSLKRSEFLFHRRPLGCYYVFIDMLYMRDRHFLPGLFLCPDCVIKSSASWQDVSEC